MILILQSGDEGRHRLVRRHANAPKRARCLATHVAVWIAHRFPHRWCKVFGWSAYQAKRPERIKAHNFILVIQKRRELPDRWLADLAEDHGRVDLFCFI